jgi:hypothetical protein
MPGKRPDAHETHRLLARKSPPNPGQELNEIQLIEKVVLEPEDQFIVRLVGLDCPPPASQVVDGTNVGASGRIEVTCADFE